MRNLDGLTHCSSVPSGQCDYWDIWCVSGEGLSNNLGIRTHQNCQFDPMSVRLHQLPEILPFCQPSRDPDDRWIRGQRRVGCVRICGLRIIDICHTINVGHHCVAVRCRSKISQSLLYGRRRDAIESGGIQCSESPGHSSSRERVLNVVFSSWMNI